MTTASMMITCAGCKHSYADTALFCPNCGTPKARQATAARDPLIGKVLGERFSVLELIGQGASGTIYRGEHVTLRRKVALKVLHTELSRDDLAVERFRREATTVAEIDNEHIVETHDFGRTPDGRLYLAMELLEGESLETVLTRERQLSVERTADILIQVGEALMEAHAIGYVHRDLRPRNIYLAVRRGKANFVKLLDFGLAKLVDTDAHAASTSLGMTFGDPRYMSPEQARGDRIDRRADIYQLGCVAYEMLTGAPPFTGNRVFDILSKQVSDIPAPLPTRRPGVPLWMEAAVAKMLAKDPENRFATTTRMVEALRRGLETGEVMEDDIARRRESIPPPSVSRVMQKMGLPAPVDAPVHAPVSSPAVIGKETLRGHLEGPLPPLERRRTGTPELGVPAVSAPPVAAPIQPPVAGQIEPPRPEPVVVAAPVAPDHEPTVHVANSGPVAGAVRAPETPEPGAAAAGRSKLGSSHAGPTDSSSWFDEGERASAEAARVRSRKRDEDVDASLESPSSTDLSLYDDAAPRRRWPLVLGALLALGLVGGAIAFALSGRDSGSSTSKVAEPSPPPSMPVVGEVPPSQIITPAGNAGSAASGTASSVTPPSAVAVTPPPSGTDRTPAGTTGSRRPAGGTRTDGDDAAARRPNVGGGWFDSPATPPVTSPPTTPPVTSPPTTPPPTTPPVTPTPTPTGVSGTDGPVDPYGGSTDTPAPHADGAESPDKKAEFFANLGKQQLASGDTAGAAASFKKALELDARSVPATIGMGEIALRQGLFGDAIAHLKKAARLAPRSSHVFTLLGEAYLGTGNNAVAADNFKKALQLDPDNVRAREGFEEAQSRVPPAEDDAP